MDSDSDRQALMRQYLTADERHQAEQLEQVACYLVDATRRLLTVLRASFRKRWPDITYRPSHG